ncbi:MAG: hypothetical protein O7B99_09540, partial [Planctomycetota bacterium]|nr:hypothetical protein [Planctomycetota bacterium]
ARRCDGDPRRVFGALALASGGSGASGGLLPGALTKTIEVIAMNTATKVAAATVTTALVFVGALGLYNLGGDGEPARPSGARASARPEPAPLEDAGVEAPSGPVGARSVVNASSSEASTAEIGEPTAVEPAPERTVVTLRAVDQEGVPIAGAWAQVTTEEGLERDFPPSLESGVSGEVELELPKGASWQYMGGDVANAYLALHAPGYATDFLVATVVRGGSKDHGDVVLAPGGGVAGYVLDPAGAPVVDALLVGTTAHVGGDLDSARLTGPEMEGGRPTVRSDANGRFELAGLHLGEALVWAHAQGSLWTASEPVLVREGIFGQGITLVLEPVPEDARITGRVVDPTGMGVEGAEVLYASRSWTEESVTAGPDGRFQIDVTLRTPHTLLARDPGGGFGPTALRQASPGESEIVLALTPLRHLVVRAVDTDGEPIENAWAKAIRDEGDHLGKSWLHTDASGRVEILASGEPFLVTIGKDGYQHRRLGPFDPDALPQEEVAELESLPMIRGRVLHGEDPVADARVELVEDHRIDSREVYKGFPMRFFGAGNTVVQSEADGSFALSMRRGFRGTYIVIAEKEGFALAELALPGVAPTRPVDGVEVQLTDGGAIEGQVLVPAKRNPEGIVVAASRGDGRPRVTRTDSDGRYRFERLTPGSWRVEDRDVEPEGRIMAMASAEEAPFGWNCEVFEGKTIVHDLDLRWQEGLAVEGRLAFDGVGAAGWSAVLEASEHSDRPLDIQPVVLDEDGRFAIPARPGRPKLVLRSPTGRTPMVVVETEVVVDADRRPFELDLATGTIEGRRPEPTHMRTVWAEEGTLVYTTFDTDDEGAYRVEGVTAGELGLSHETEGKHGHGWYHLKGIEVVAGETTTID